LSIDTVKRDYESMERDIERLDSIMSCKFVVDGDEVKEIHIVSNGTRPPKQISRDVQSVLIATYESYIDHKIISIAELPGGELSKRTSRLKIERISYEERGKKTSVEVALADESKIYESSTTGINTNRNVERMLVKTVLENVEKSLGIQDRFILEEVKTVDLSSSNGVVIVVLVYITEEQEKRLCGSSLIEGDYRRAVVKATLDALNRIIIR
jgi:hypothetical protein